MHTEMLTTEKAVPCEVPEWRKVYSGKCTRGHLCHILLDAMSCLFDWGGMCKQWTRLFGRGHFRIVQLPSCGMATAHCSSQIYSKKEQNVKQRIWKMCRLVRN